MNEHFHGEYFGKCKISLPWRLASVILGSLPSADINASTSVANARKQIQTDTSIRSITAQGFWQHLPGSALSLSLYL